MTRIERIRRWFRYRFAISRGELISLILAMWAGMSIGPKAADRWPIVGAISFALSVAFLVAIGVYAYLSRDRTHT